MTQAFKERHPTFINTELEPEDGTCDCCGTDDVPCWWVEAGKMEGEELQVANTYELCEDCANEICS